MIAAQMACDQHVIKMPLESAQMMSTIARSCGFDVGYKSTHAKHPATLWAGASAANYEWLTTHALGLLAEYTERYGRTHACQPVVEKLGGLIGSLSFSKVGLLPFVQTMPEARKRESAVAAYRAFYMNEKRKFATWKKSRPAPFWWPYT